MTSALMEAEDSSIVSENARIIGLESQILNSQEIIVRLNRELDSALLRITTLENVCSENQNDLHEKRSRLKQLNDEITEREETNERLNQKLSEKNELIIQLEQEIENKDNQYQLLFNEFGDISTTELNFQIQFDRQLRQLILHDLDDDDNLSNYSPEIIIDQYNNNQRLKFHNLLQESLITEDISNLIDSDDVLFELLTHLNSLSRLKETLSRDSKELNHIRTLLHLKIDNNDELINDLVNKRQCIEYLRSKIDNNHDLTDFDLVKYVLHDYYNYQQQKNELKEYLELDNDNILNYSRILIERYTEAIHVQVELNERIKTQDQIIEQFKNQIDELQSSVTPTEKPVDQDQQLIIDELTKEINELKNIIEDLQKQLDNIKQIADEFAPKTDENEESDITRIHQTLADFHQKLLDKTQMDAELFEKSQDEFYLKVKELFIDVEEDQPEEIINKIKELLEISQTKTDEYEKLRNYLNIKDENLIESVIKLNENYHRLEEEHQRLVQKENLIDKNIEQMMDKIDLSSSDYLSKFQTYSTKVNTLCKLISNDDVNIDQALIIYQEKTQHDNDVLEKFSNFKQQLLTRLSVDDEEQIFNRLNEIEQINNNLKEKLQNNNETTSTLTSLNVTISEQRNKIREYEETTEKLRSQRERMLNKMKEMKANNETLTNELKQANKSIDELHRNEIDYKNKIEEIEQQLRNTNSQIQVTLDDCRTQQDLQETMKLETESIKNEMETQRKLYENRCRQIINEKKQLEKTSKEYLEQKQILEDENKRFQTILYTIKDTLENVDDINSIVDTILKLRDDHLTLTNQLTQYNKQIKIENEKYLLNIHQQESKINEYIQTKFELEKRLIDNEQQIINFKKQIEENINQYQSLQNEYQLYKENNQIKTNSQIAIINIEQSPPPVQQIAESNAWTAIDVKDEEIPLTTMNKHSTIDTPTALFNLLGELKSKLGITLTHRPRSSSVFFLYLCAVHLLTFYLLFIRHC